MSTEAQLLIWILAALGGLIAYLLAGDLFNVIGETRKAWKEYKEKQEKEGR